MIDVVLLIGRLLFVALLYLFLFALMKTGIGLVRGQRKKERTWNLSVVSFDNHSLPIIIWLGTLHSPTFRGMFPHAFLIFHTIYFWYTKCKYLIINTYHFHDSFWHADCDYE